MGPSAVDLPDPLNNSDEALAALGADDLLSQMAGDEIDRMMRDDRPVPVLELRAPEPEPLEDVAPIVEEGRKETPGANAEADGAKPQADVQDNGADRVEDRVERHVEGRVERGVEEAAEADVEHRDDEAGEELSDLARELEDDERLHDRGERIERGERVDDATIEAVTENMRYQLDELLAEVDLTPVPFMQEATRGGEYAPVVREEVEIPVYLAPLVWMNAPVSMLPGWARKIVGVVSVVLFVVAVGALGYVLFLRSTTQL